MGYRSGPPYGEQVGEGIAVVRLACKSVLHRSFKYSLRVVEVRELRHQLVQTTVLDCDGHNCLLTKSR